MRTYRWHLLPETELRPLFLNLMFRRASVALLGLFSPIYIFKIAQSLTPLPKFWLAMVFSFFLLLYTVKLLTLPLAENLALKVGFKKISYFSSIPFALFLVFLIFSQKNPFWLLLAAIFWGANASLFWFSYHGLFVKLGDAGHFGWTSAEAQVLETAANVLSPILGGFVIWKFGFRALFLLAGIIFAISLVALWFAREEKPHHDARLREVWRLFATHKRMVTAYLGLGGEAGFYGVAWPLFLFIVFGQILVVGEVISAAILAAAVLTLVVGFWVDRLGKRAVIRFGAPAVSISWLVRIFTRTPGAIVGVDAFYRLTDQMLTIPLLVWTYQKALEGGTGQALYFREISITLGTIFALFLAEVIILFGASLEVLFVLAAISALLPLLVVKRK